LAPVITEHVPVVMTEYHEPFAGGAAVFCELIANEDLNECARVSLGDINDGLMDLYFAVQDPKRMEELLANLLYFQRKYHHPQRDAERLYYEQRDLWNQGERTPARFVFLKQTAFNGLWRLNRKGELNSSWGKYAKATILDEGNIKAWHETLQYVELRYEPYTDLVVAPGAVVYVDPPYYGTFDGYSADGFTHADHVELLCQIWKWRNAGAFVIYSNSTADELGPLMSFLWPEAEVQTLATQHSISCDGAGRGAINELLATG
jgi:DNA adenine methylase